MDDKSSLKEAWSGHVNHLKFGGHRPYVWNGWSYSGQILYTVSYVKSQHKDENHH